MGKSEIDFVKAARQQDALISYEAERLVEAGSITEASGISLRWTEVGMVVTLSDTVESGERETSRFLLAGGRIYILLSPESQGRHSDLKNDNPAAELRDSAGRIIATELPADDMNNARRSAILSRLAALRIAESRPT